MDGERRQAHRRLPIFVEVEGGKVFEAHPLPWQDRNDFGSAVVQQNAKSANEAVRLYVDPDTSIPELTAKLYERAGDPIALLKMAYPNVKPVEYKDLTWRQLIELLRAALEVNELGHLARLIDPNSNPPTENGGSPAVGEEEIGQRIESLVASSSQDSEETTSEDSPTPKSEAS
jgi:hypothetical protein